MNTTERHDGLAGELLAVLGDLMTTAALQEELAHHDDIGEPGHDPESCALCRARVVLDKAGRVDPDADRAPDSAAQTPGQHSPGPYTLDVGDTLIRASDGTVVCDVYGMPGQPKNRANAALLKASPDLLAALEGIVNNAGYTNGQSEPTLTALRVDLAYLDKARDAIAKATGKGV